MRPVVVGRVHVALAALGVLVACTSMGDKEGVRSKDLAGLVLQPADMPGDFQRFDEGRQVEADAASGPRADRTRFGRQGGWKARYRRIGASRSRGPLVVESRVDLFESERGAREDLAAYRVAISETTATADGVRVVSDPDLGDDALATTVAPAGLANVRFFTVAWRQRNVTASVAVNGLEGKVTLDDALRLARAQEERIGAAASE